MLIFKTLLKGAALVALSAFVAGCASNSAGVNPFANPIPQAVNVTAGGTPIVVAAPPGFCVDRATIEENSGGAFMFLSDCHVPEDGIGARTPITAILTATISPTGLPGVEAGLKPALTSLSQFLESPVGLFSMGKSQVENAVSIIEAKQSERALYLLIEDTAFSDDAGASNRFWRAFTEIKGRLVALSVTGYARNDVDEARALRIIRAFMQITIDANTIPATN